MAVIIKNDSGVEKTYAGVIIADQAQYSIQPSEQKNFATDALLLTDIGNADAIVNDGVADLGISDGLDLLKGFYPKSVGLLAPDGSDIGADGDYLKIRPAIDVSKSVIDENAFTVTTEFNSIGSNSETAYLYLKNPSGSGIKALVTHLKNGTNSANVRSIVRFYADPTVTADGTSLTVINTSIKNSPPATSMEAYRLPTTSSFGSLLNIDISPANSASKGTNRWYSIDEGHSILITIENSASNVSSFADIYFIEGV